MNRFSLMTCLGVTALFAGAAYAAPSDPAASVIPFIGTANGGNVYPGATAPFGMVAFSPEETALRKDGSTRVAAPGGYAWKADHIRGFALTHMSGTGCAGASGDVPIMPVTEVVKRSPSSVEAYGAYASTFDHANEHAAPGAYDVRLDNGASVELGATARTGVMRVAFPAGRPAGLLFRVSDSEVGSSDATIHIDAAHRELTGSVTSGNFCGYLSKDRQHSYYTLHFVAVVDQPFSIGGGWRNLTVNPGATDAQGGTSYEDRAIRRPGADRAVGSSSIPPMRRWSRCASVCRTSAKRRRGRISRRRARRASRSNRCRRRRARNGTSG